MSGVQEVAKIGEGTMMVHVEMMVHQEGVLLLEGILEKEMVVDPGDQAQGMILLVTGVVQEEGEILVTDEVLPGEWETGRLLEEDLQGGTLEEMMIGEEALLS